METIDWIMAVLSIGGGTAVIAVLVLSYLAARGGVFTDED